MCNKFSARIDDTGRFIGDVFNRMPWWLVVKFLVVMLVVIPFTPHVAPVLWSWFWEDLTTQERWNIFMVAASVQCTVRFLRRFTLKPRADSFVPVEVMLSPKGRHVQYVYPRANVGRARPAGEGT